jgi:hypothetical protein
MSPLLPDADVAVQPLNAKSGHRPIIIRNVRHPGGFFLSYGACRWARWKRQSVEF